MPSPVRSDEGAPPQISRGAGDLLQALAAPGPLPSCCSCGRRRGACTNWSTPGSAPAAGQPAPAHPQGRRRGGRRALRHRGCTTAWSTSTWRTSCSTRWPTPAGIGDRRRVRALGSAPPSPNCWTASANSLVGTARRAAPPRREHRPDHRLPHPARRCRRPTSWTPCAPTPAHRSTGACSGSHHHHHLVCRSCGATVEVAGRRSRTWASEVAAAHETFPTSVTPSRSSGPARPAAGSGPPGASPGVVAAGEHHQDQGCATHRRTVRRGKLYRSGTSAFCCRASHWRRGAQQRADRLLGHPGPRILLVTNTSRQQLRERDQLRGRRRRHHPQRGHRSPWVTVSAPSASLDPSATSPGHRPTGRPTSGPPTVGCATRTPRTPPMIAPVAVGPGLSWNTYSA